jgi:membrane protease YdiL (CAAX protease family)
VVAWLVVAGIVAIVVRVVVGGFGITLTYLGATVAVALVSLLAWRFFDRRPPQETPLAVSRGAARQLGYGIVLGGALVAGVVGVLALSGMYQVSPQACRISSLFGAVTGMGAMFLFAAAFEELIFRGYMLFTLAAGTNRWIAVAVTSVLFAAGHFGNPNYGWIAAANIALLGVVLAVWVLVTRSIWGAVGLHLGWNWALAGGAAIPVSGVTIFESPCHLGTLVGPEWVTGGEFGPEAGIVTALAWVVMAIVFRFGGRTLSR